MHVDRISMELPVLHFEGLSVIISVKCCISVHEDCFYLSIQCRP